MDILSGYNREKSNLVSILQAFQHELGYLPEDIILRVADYLRISPATVYSVATFYPRFKFVPSGKKVICACRGTACHVRGGGRVLREIEKQLGIKAGETTPDMEYTLETVSCMGACVLAPAMMVDDEIHGQMTPAKVSEVLDGE
ncbi:MAG: NADH-quinone oxidoreductase subunit NuoE [Dehalococcoidales bacterium]|nr:NADH-quinone oxidoreductase subunit NuoE [Dehalococcoidales bacterium]